MHDHQPPKNKKEKKTEAFDHEPYDEGRRQYFMDIDRMVNEGLGGGNVTCHNGLIGESTTDTMDEIESE